MEIYCVKKHLNNGDQTRHISKKLSELCRLLLKMKRGNLATCFKDILHPKLFREVIESVIEYVDGMKKKKLLKTHL